MHSCCNIIEKLFHGFIAGNEKVVIMMSAYTDTLYLSRSIIFPLSDLHGDAVCEDKREHRADKEYSAASSYLYH